MSRLIDADALVNIFNRYYGNDEIEVDDVLGWINEQPTIEERKKGKWIEHKWAEECDGLLISNYECSECSTWERKETDFCPNCGADMRGGKR